MFYSRRTLKRFVACGGIALALIASVQQSHALCGIIGCNNLTRTAPGNLTKITDGVIERGGCCGHKTESHRSAPPQDDNNDSPCGPNCLCCQPPEPREEPRDTTELTKSRISTVLPAIDCPVSIDRQLEKFDCGSINAFKYRAPGCDVTCAKLCRFLI